MGNSLIFTAASSQYLSITGDASANQQKLTIAFWFKQTTTGASKAYYSAGDGTTNNRFLVEIESTNAILILGSVSGSAVLNLVTTATFTDTTNWHHLLVGVDTTQATAANRVSLYIDGTLISAFSTSTYPSLNANLATNNTGTQYISNNNATGSGLFLNDKLAQYYYIDGQNLTPTSFITGTPGIPKTYTGTYTGVFDFFLPFSNGASTTTLGADSSGEGNNWTLNNMTTANQSADYPGFLQFVASLLYPWENPVRTRWVNAALQQPHAEPAMQPLPHWFLPVPLAEPVRIPLRAIQNFYSYLEANIGGPATALVGWYNWLTEPVKLKPGLPSTLQQFLALSPRLLPPANVTATMAATETGKDIADFGIDVYTPQPSKPSLAGANVSILQIPAMKGGYLSIEGGD